MNLLAIYDASDTLLTRFEYAGTRTPVSMTQGASTYYLSYDQVGSLRSMYNTSGTLQGEITYDSFGNELSNTIPLAQVIPIGFAGGYSDRDTGLVRFGYRDYDPNAGRWTAKDPIFFGGRQGNLYVYVNNNPVMYNDPEGLILPILLYMGGKALLGGVIGGGVDILLQLESGCNGGKIDWGSVGKSAGLGALTGGFGGAAAFKAGAKISLSSMKHYNKAKGLAKVKKAWGMGSNVRPGAELGGKAVAAGGSMGIAVVRDMYPDSCGCPSNKEAAVVEGIVGGIL